jgi:DNA polymerase III delta prime subunit
MPNSTETILAGLAKTQKISNAYLFLGGSAEGKLQAALKFAQELIGTEKAVHPDIIVIERPFDPASKKQKASLSIDQIRELKEITRYGPAEAQWQVVIIKDADTLSAQGAQAGNSFLRLLEEPAPGVVFILIANREEGLPQTILSRCQKVAFPEAAPTISDETREMFKQLKLKPYDLVGNSRRLLGCEDAEELVTGLFTLFAEEGKTREARVSLDILKGIKRRANRKLALDLLGVRLWKKS